jgi:hypothetical protein
VTMLTVFAPKRPRRDIAAVLLLLAHTTTSPSLDIKIKERATRPQYPPTLHSQSARNQSIIND